MNVQGACHCGRIRYEAEVDPEKVAHALTGARGKNFIGTPQKEAA